MNLGLLAEPEARISPAYTHIYLHSLILSTAMAKPRTFRPSGTGPQESLHKTATQHCLLEANLKMNAPPELKKN